MFRLEPRYYRNRTDAGLFAVHARSLFGVLTVLADPGKLEAVMKVVFAETTTLGVRVQEVARRVLAREITEVATKFGLVRVKVAQVPKGGPLKASPEYRDCKRIAEQTGLPLRRVMQEVERALRRIS